MGNWNMAGFLHEGREIRTLREVLKRLREAYCGTIGYEYMHIPDRERCNWLRERIETPEKAIPPIPLAPPPPCWLRNRTHGGRLGVRVARTWLGRAAACCMLHSTYTKHKRMHLYRLSCREDWVRGLGIISFGVPDMRSFVPCTRSTPRTRSCTFSGQAVLE